MAVIEHGKGVRVYAVAFGLGNKHVVTGASDGTMRVIDALSGVIQMKVSFFSMIYAVAL